MQKRALGCPAIVIDDEVKIEASLCYMVCAYSAKQLLYEGHGKSCYAVSVIGTVWLALLQAAVEGQQCKNETIGMAAGRLRYDHVRTGEDILR